MRPNECCNDPANCDVTEPAEGLVCEQCRVCGCRHFELTVDPAELGLLGSSLG
jgi:hypothetical protein